jgi:hypothetical protein
MKFVKNISALILVSFVALYFYELMFEIPFTKKMIDNFFPLLYISAICLFIVFLQTNKKIEVPKAALTAFYLFFFWNIVSFTRSAITATEYLDIKTLYINKLGGLSLLIPLAIAPGLNYKESSKMLKFVFYTLLFSFILIPLTLTSAETEIYLYSRNVVPVVIFILFIPYLKIRQTGLILIVAALSLFIAIAWRSNIIHILTSVAIVFIFYLRKLMNYRWLVFLQIILFIVPVYLLFRGIQGDNIFNRSTNTEYLITSKGEQENLAEDTRTELYTDVLTDLYETGDIWLGRGANGKYKTDHDFDLPVELGNMRPDVEVGFLKLLIYNGVLGIILYGILLWFAAYYGIAKTNNTLSQLLGILIATHWAVLFLENIITYNPYYYFHWFSVGLCLSHSFRSLTNDEIKQWLRFGK